MKRFLKHIFLLTWVFLWAFSSQAVTVTIGTGTLTSNYPFTTYWMDGRTQILYTAAEITAGGGVAGNITSIAFNVISNSTQVMNSFTVRMQNTTATSIPAFVETGWTTVLTTNWAVPGTGWQTITLATPFAWDGTSNLMIEICYDNTSYTSYSPVYSTAATGMTWGRYQDLSTASGCTITGGSAQANRPNIQLEITPVGPQPVTVTIGNGTTTVGYPYTTYWHDGRTQILVTKAEILAAGGFPGMITDLAFNVSSVNSSYQPMNGFTINVQNYPGTLTGFVTGGWTTVYQTTYTVQNTGWNTHTFTAPFVWNGTDNLLFEICYDNTSYTSYSYVYASTVASGLCYYRYTDGATGCSLTSPNSSTSRPNVRFTIQPMTSTTLSGVVTNASTGAPIIGALVQCGDSTAYTIADGSYSMKVLQGNNKVVTCSKLGFDTQSVTINISGATQTQNFALLENTNPPGVVFASLNTAQTAVTITWGVPQGPYEIVYDDGQFENMTSWAVGGNINALKFTPINQYPVQITGGRVHIGDGSYPSGANLQPFTMAVYDDDGALGYPNTELATVEVTPTHYGWVDFTFPTPVTITSGNFYLGMIQGGNYPNCVPIAIDETNPSMRSYSRFVTGNAPWVLAGYNDFMIRAIVVGAGGPLDLSADNNVPGKYIEKHRENVGTYSLKIPRLIGGQEGVAQYIPVNTDNGDNSDVLLGYQVWRLKMGEENTPSAWVSVGTPTSTSIIDNSWPTLSCAGYRWAVKAKYTGDRWSDAVFSNVLGKCMTAQVTFNISMCGTGGNPEGTMVQLTNTQYPDTSYFAIAPANGVVTFPHVWKGNYDIWIFKFTYQAWELNDDIMGDKTY
ncbi:MAG: carboxypeptidase-like regulatory domain-containing protein, partial [Bacteroidales bacterium]|nr:carboxypeptidase-like regulatory domain-containing protein [Bacteroidales bacterium]